jgi:hypothetical protein
MIKNIKRLIVIPVLFIMTPVVWAMWALIEIACWIMEYIEQVGDRFFEWAEK